MASERGLLLRILKAITAFCLTVCATQAMAQMQDGPGYTGHVADRATGLVYMQQRYYDPEIGRLPTVDPVGVSSVDGSNFNRYGYANNNPYRYTDPDGRWAEDVLLGIPSMALGLGSAYDNVRGGRYGAAALDAVGIAADAAAIAIPGIPGGAGYGINAARAAGNIADTTRRIPSPATDRAGNQIGRIIVDARGNAMIEPLGGRTVAAGRNGVDTHTLYPNGSNYQRLNPQGHPNNPMPHGHGHGLGTGPGMRGQGASLDVYGNAVPWNSPAAHWPIK